MCIALYIGRIVFFLFDNSERCIVDGSTNSTLYERYSFLSKLFNAEAESIKPDCSSKASVVPLLIANGSLNNTLLMVSIFG